jgi:hypothetical protein
VGARHGVALVTVAVAGAFVRAADVFFLSFLAVLLAILLRGGADAVSRWTGIGRRWSLALVVATPLMVVILVAVRML